MSSISSAGDNTSGYNQAGDDTSSNQVGYDLAGCNTSGDLVSYDLAGDDQLTGYLANLLDLHSLN